MPLPSRVASTPTATVEVVATRVVDLKEPLRLPQGFGVSLFADRLGEMGALAVAPTGDVFASLPLADEILVLPDRDQDGVADQVLVYARGEPLNEPHGLAFWEDWLYVACTDSVWRYAYIAGDLAPWQPVEHIVNLPGGGQHSARALVFGLEGRMYVSVGSSCNLCLETDVRRAAVLRHSPTGEEPAIFATGLRDPVALTLDRSTNGLWAVDRGRDGLGDLVPDEVNWILAGNHYGWPFCFGANVPDPEMGNDPRLCEHARMPSIVLPAHAAPAGLVFYDRDQFPPAYRGNLFIALAGRRGSSSEAGHRIVRVPFRDGQPAGAPMDFATGWMWPDMAPWGQPHSLAIAKDGSLLVGDPYSGRIYRIFHRGGSGG